MEKFLLNSQNFLIIYKQNDQKSEFNKAIYWISDDFVRFLNSDENVRKATNQALQLLRQFSQKKYCTF